MDRDEILDFFALRDKAWKKHDAGLLAAGHMENGELESPLWGSIQGRQAIQKTYTELFSIFPDWEYACEDLLIDGNRAAEFIKIAGTQQKDLLGSRPTGKRLHFRAASIYFFSEAKIAKEVRVYDFTGMLLQLGIIKAKPTF